MRAMKRPRVVVVDDESSFASMVEAALSEDYEVATGHDGKAGLALCQAADTALLVTDIGMPGMDGVELLKHLKASPRTSRIPVLVLTATHFNTISRKAFDKDPQVKAILHKPCTLEQLQSTVRRLVV